MKTQEVLPEDKYNVSECKRKWMRGKGYRCQTLVVSVELVTHTLNLLVLGTGLES